MVTVRVSPGFDRIVPEHAKLEKIASGCIFNEGPVWVPREGYLAWTDIVGDAIWKWAPGEGASVIMRPAGKPDGMTLDAEGRLVVAGWSNRTVWRWEHDGSTTTLASHYQGQKLNSPNDIVVKKSDGSIYFTDPSGGLFNVAMGGEDLQKYDDTNPVYRLEPEDGKLIRLDTPDIFYPNGLAFSPDESRLYIIDSPQIRVFDVKADGNLENDRLYVDLRGDEPGGPDGMRVDVEGNVYSGGSGGLWVIDPDGNRLGLIRVPEAFSNVAWGDDDWRSLYITGRTSIYRIRLKIPGVPV